MSRRWYAPSTMLVVGAGIPDGPGRTVPWTRQGCRVLRNGYAFALIRRSTAPAAARRHTQVPPYEHGRTAPLRWGQVRHRARYDIRPPSATRAGGGGGGRPPRGTRKATPPPPAGGGGTALPLALPGVAPSADGAMDDWGFRPLRRAGISRRARRGSFARCDGRPKALPLETAIF